ncbi:MAG: hypothetical protein ACLRR3_04520 [Eubacterium sp.]
MFSNGYNNNVIVMQSIVEEMLKAEENTTIITEKTTNKALTAPSCFKGMSSKRRHSSQLEEKQ